MQVFRDDQDDDSTNSLQKKAKLTALLDQQTTPVSNSSTNIKDEPVSRTSLTKLTPVTTTSNSNAAQSQEEKRQAVRKLIESIPTKKEDLFTYPLDWSLLDSVCIAQIISSFISHFFVFEFQESIGKTY